MAEFRLLAAADRSPTACVACATHAGPFLDLGIDFWEYGHLWLCASCVTQMARLVGMRDALELEELGMELGDAYATIAGLEEELARAREGQVVTLEDARRLLGRREPAQHS